MKRLTILLIAVWFISCRGFPQPQTGPYATLYIFQKGSFEGSNFDIYINNQLVAKDFRPRSWFSVQMSPGAYELRTAGRPAYAVEEKTARLQLLAGKTYYLEAVLDYDYFSRALYLMERTEADFLKRKKNLQLNERAKKKLE